MRSIGIALAALALTGASAAYAAAPEHSWVSIDDTITWNDCGFTVEESVVGSLHLISWFDDAGKLTRQTVTAPNFHVTFLNPANGKSVTTASPYVAHKEANPDGSLTIAFTGLVGSITGGGPAAVTAGREVIIFSDGGVELVSKVGPFGDLCEALSATIG